MRVVVDTNVVISALLTASLPRILVDLWLDNRFELVTSSRQLEEIGQVSRYPKLRERLHPVKVGRLVNDLREHAVTLGRLPNVTACDDPDDNYLLGMVEAAGADFLVTGDKADLLGMKRHGSARIVAVREFLEINKFL